MSVRLHITKRNADFVLMHPFSETLYFACAYHFEYNVAYRLMRCDKTVL